MQTVERDWKRRIIARIPWHEQLGTDEELERISKAAVAKTVSKRQYDFVSPHYNGPLLLDVLGVDDPFSQYNHPHRELRDELALDTPDADIDTTASLEELGTVATRHLERIERDLQSCADRIDEAVYDCFSITDEQRETILKEIALRTIEDPREREEYVPEDITEPGERFPEMVKDLLVHLTLRIVQESDNGIVHLSTVDEKDDLLSRLEAAFEDIFGEHAANRLAEVDDLLGNQRADEEAYPNLRTWLEESLFDYHVSTFDRTPILWRLTTERLVSDPTGEGFGCLIDYHQLDDATFDCLQNQYLEPRKNLLRERQNVANRRQNDESRSTSEQANAVAEYDRCESGIEQIEAFEDRLAELVQTSPRDWSAENQQTAGVATERVVEFRRRTEKRLDIVDELATLDGVDMGELFTENFYEKIENHRQKWLDALEDLEAAFEAYTKDADKPVEAHRYDLFEYFADDLLGNSHFASNGILYMTYYFDDFEQADQARLDDAGSSRRQRLLSQLASDLDAYIELGDSISDDCKRLSSEISADWADRALSEITTAGYQPTHKHGVAINITPLSDAKIVPKTVEENIL